MNKIYKVIWSKVRNCYVAVSEIAKRNGKSCTSVNCGAKVNRGRAGVALSAAVGATLLAGVCSVLLPVRVALAADVDTNTTINSDTTSSVPYYELVKDGGVTFTVGSSGNVNYIISSKSGNTITIQSGGKVSNNTNPISGWSFSIIAGINNNNLNSAGTISSSIAGGLNNSTTDSVVNNHVAISGGKVSGDVFGGFSNSGNAGENNKGNTVNISGTSTIGSSDNSSTIYGGRAVKNATNNTVNINLTTNGKIWGNVYGGWVNNNNSPVAKDNSVTVDAGEISGDVYGGFALIGGSVEGNSVSMKGTVGGNIYGGIIRNANSDASLNKNVENNHVTITNGTVTKAVYGGSNAGTGSTINNSVTINGGTVRSNVYGGYASKGFAGGNGANEGNTVTISGNTTTVVNGYVCGGMSVDGIAANNKVEISGGTINNEVWGGSSTNGDATNNKVVISGGTVSSNVIGGRSYSTGSATDNTVTISNATVNGSIEGGYSISGSTARNTVSLKNVTLTGWVAGGSGNTSNHTYHTVILNNVKSSSEIYGGANGGKTGNTLILESAGNTAYRIGGFQTIKLSDTLLWENDATVLAAYLGYGATQILNISDATNLSSHNSYGKMALLSAVNHGNYIPGLFSEGFTLQYKENNTSKTATISTGSRRAIVKAGTSTTENNFVNGVKFAYNQKSHMVYIDSAINNVLYSIADNVTGITFGNMTWGTPRSASGTHFDFGGVTNTNITTTGLKFANPQNIVKDDTTSLLTNATNLAAGTDISHSQSITDYNIGNGVKLNATLNGNVVRTTAGQIGYKSNGTTLNSVNIAGWNGTASAAINSDWLKPNAGSDYVDVTIGNTFSAPNNLTPGTPVPILTADSAFFNDNSITDNTKKDKYQSFEFTGDTENKVTFAGTQYKGVKASNDGKFLNYVADRKRVSTITLGSNMTWGDSIGRNAGSDYSLYYLSSVDATGLSFTNPDEVSGTKDLVTAATTTSIKNFSSISHTQNFTKTMNNDVKVSATLAGTVSRPTIRVIRYTATGTTVSTVDLKDWDNTKDEDSIPMTWAAKTGGVDVVSTGSAATGLAAGATKVILTALTDNFFGTVDSSAGAYSTATFSNNDGDTGVTLSGDHYKGVKVEDNGKTLKYYAETMDTDGITLGTMTWGTGRTAGDLYIFNNVNSIDATGFSFSNPDAVSGSMVLLSGATGLAAGKTVTGASHSQDFTKSLTNGVNLSSTLKGTVSTVSGAVKYTATGTTISTIDLSGWDVSTSSVIPTGWSLKKDGSNAVEATVETANMDATKLSNLPNGSSVPIITATGTDFFDGITINGANAWNGAVDIVDADTSGVSIVGTSTGTGVKVDSGNKNQIIYQKTKEAITNLRLAGITFEAGTTARTFGNTYDLTAAPIVADNNLFTTESQSLMETGDTMTLVDATGAIKNASNETLAQFNGGSSKSYQIGFTDTIADLTQSTTTDTIVFAGKHTDTLSQEDDAATSTKKSLLTYTVGDKIVETATLSGPITWTAGGTYYTNGMASNQKNRNSVFTFDANSKIDISGVDFTATTDPLNKTMTLISGNTINSVAKNVAGSFTDGKDTPRSFGVALSRANGTLEAKASGSAEITTGGNLTYTVDGVAIDKINVTSITNDADTVPDDWTLAKDSSDKVIAKVETDSLVVASSSGLEPGETKVIIEAATGSTGSTGFFKDVAVNGSHAWKVDGSTITSDLDIGGVAITGTQTQGGVKVNEANTNQIIYEESKKKINTLTLGSVTFANDDGTAATVARTFDKTYDVSTATISTDDLAFANSDIMETGNSMRIVDASAAIPNAISNKKLSAFAGQTYEVAFSDTITGKNLTLKGTHTDTLAQDAAQTKLTYTVGDKVVKTATLNGTVSWNDGTSYYTNGTDVNQNNVAATYTFDGNTSVDISGVQFNARVDPLAGSTKSMTLLKGVTGVVATKVSSTPSFAVTLDQTNTKLDAKATGASGVSGNDVTFTVSGVTLDKITVKSANGTADKVPASWTMAAGATIETDSMTVPELAAGTHVDILQSDTDGFFAKVAINGANAYGNTQDAFTESDAAKSVTIAGTQDKGVTLNTEKKHLIYKAGTLDVASVTLGLAEWKKGATVFDRSGAGYNYAGVAALGTDGFAVSYASPETVATGDSMTLLQANATLKDMAEQLKQTSYSFAPVSGVTIDAAITGTLEAKGGNVTYTATANQASKLTFTSVDWKDSGALMTRPSNITFAGADVDTAKIHFQNVKELDANRKMTLVSDFGDSVGTITGTKYTVGAGLEGEGAASLSGSDLIFTTKTGARDLAALAQTHNTLMVMEAGMAVLAAGREHLGQAMVGLADPQNAGSDGTRIGASMGGGWSRYKTGSHVNSNNWNVAAAVGSKRELKKGSLEWGVFGEYGKSNYTLHSDAGRGDGDSHYAGGGLMAKWTNKHDVYTEASVRLGRLSDTANNLLRDAVGNSYGYDVHANYFGAHVGIGKIIRYKGGKSLDVYGKYFYTKRDGVDFASGGNNYSLDSVASSILRVGARYGTTDKKWNWYGGLAYEYEFDGKSEGTVDGVGIRAASVKGGSVRGEIGLRMSATKTNPWQTDISIYGYGGKHRGFGGSVNVAYMF